MNLKTNNMDEDQLHKLARMFMAQFPLLSQMSLDEFLEENCNTLYPEQYNLGLYIVDLFEQHLMNN